VHDRCYTNRPIEIVNLGRRWTDQFLGVAAPMLYRPFASHDRTEIGPIVKVWLPYFVLHLQCGPTEKSFLCKVVEAKIFFFCITGFKLLPFVLLTFV
jgi:hypothetical protein